MFAVKALIAAPIAFDVKKFERDLTELEEKVGVEVRPVPAMKDR
jgi:hypothetical protein